MDESVESSPGTSGSQCDPTPSSSGSAAKRLLRPAYLTLRRALPINWQVNLDFLIAHGRFPDLRHPETFNEKMAWRKLYDHDARFPDLMDKIKVKDYIAGRFGPDLVIPTLATYERASELDFSSPPLCTPPYVIKTNHGCGFNVFVKDDKVDHQAVKQSLHTWLGLDFADVANEWGYHPITPRILVEPLVGEVAPPTDYKFHVFGGNLYAIETVINRFTNYQINFYDPRWQQLDIRRYARRPRSDRPVLPPRSLAQMISLAEEIGRDFSYVRVDLYEVSGTVKFGEMSFYAGSAYDRFEPADWDEKFGCQWQLGDPFAGPVRGPREAHAGVPM
jgi:teichuronopeptide biosynthesis TupA-like protein